MKATWNELDTPGNNDGTVGRLAKLVGPHGVHALGFVLLALFLAFLWVFDFTSFF